MTVTAGEGVVNPEEVVVNLLKLNGDQLRGQIRLQREAYLLDRCGADFGFSFVYHRYGPYSFELVDGWTGAQANDRITIAEKPGPLYGVYSIFELNEEKEKKEDKSPLGGLSVSTASKRLEMMDKVSDGVLELAAAIAYLGEIEEVKIRKPLEATKKQIEKAQKLLEDLGIEEKMPTGQ